ncbi:hypothetical protein HHK36_030688 [Tetracentron sinense]|uniref:C2H2-type domain-containing protein n=1 Tax=Tetracentron sinense TaxID=13715 RepID=A0A834Y9S4_TETSI|nr:hypothetical protein HHK36_030688 [Tetracentron sinense]
MKDSGEYCQFTGGKSDGNETTVKFSGAGVGAGEDFRQMPFGIVDSRVPLHNLSILHQKLDSIQRFLSESVSRNSMIGEDQMDVVSTEIASAIHHTIVNGAALLACSQQQNQIDLAGKVSDQRDLKAPMSSIFTGNLTGPSYSFAGKVPISSLISAKATELVEKSMKSTDLGGSGCNSICGKGSSKVDLEFSTRSLVSGNRKGDSDPKVAAADEEMKDEIDDDAECEIVELDAVELLAEHIHICDICGKGFKRDANLRMHMRAHGEQFKSPGALVKPDRIMDSITRTRFSCPFVGCNRNKSHKKFRSLKSVICVKNHFKRSHCPKMFSCNRCNKKSFSVLTDLKSHLKHCGESKWLCSCGTSFSRKDKLFGHMTLFEGHMPAVAGDNEKSKGTVIMEDCVDEQEEETHMEEGESPATVSDNGFFDSLLESFGETSSDYFKDVFGSPALDLGMDELYED